MKVTSWGMIVLSLLLGMSLTGCQQKAETTQSAAGKETAIEHAQKHLDPKYVCPMHPQIVRDAPGKCPICGMDLILQKNEPASAAVTEKKIKFYRHPHKPDVTSDKPQKDEMGMDYIPVYEDGTPASGNAVTIAPQVVQNMGVRTTKVFKDKLVREIDTVGTVEVNDQRVHHIHLRTQGWIERLYVRSSGERVKKGQLLLEVYSPELVNAQLEYIQAMNVGNPRLLPISRERLLALGLSEKQIQRLGSTKKAEQLFQVYSPQDGIVEGLTVRHGMYVMPNTDVMIIASLDDVWILADVLERQAAWVKPGQSARVHLDYLPSEKLIGKVEYVYPRLNPKTRTLRVRLRFDNPGEILKPDMFARVTLHAEEKNDALLIPREAVIRTAESSRVLRVVGDGQFLPTPVEVGLETNEHIEVLAGLSVGDEVVTSGQFLIDSEASLRASLQRMETTPAKSGTLSKPRIITGTGVIQRVAKDVVNLKHDPIPALEWPSMTMDFTVAAGVSLKNFNKGDAVEFELQEQADEYVITAIRKHSH